MIHSIMFTQDYRCVSPVIKTAQGKIAADQELTNRQYCTSRHFEIILATSPYGY